MTRTSAVLAAVLALLAAQAGPSVARADGAGHGYHGGYGYHAGPGALHGHRLHRPGPVWWYDVYRSPFHRSHRHHGYRHRHHHHGSGAFLTWRAPAPRHAGRMPPRVHSTRCERGAWREADGRIVRGVACRGADGRWRLAD